MAGAALHARETDNFSKPANLKKKAKLENAANLKFASFNCSSILAVL
jgi:hypothetical protein